MESKPVSLDELVTKDAEHRAKVAACAHAFTESGPFSGEFGRRCPSCDIHELPWLRGQVARLRKALESSRKGFAAYFEYWSAEHEDDNCPNDDTCECPLVRGVNAAFDAVDAALSPQEPK